MGSTFGEKFEQALAEKRQADPGYGLRTLARALADGDVAKAETIRRRLNKYRPPKGGGAAEVKPTDPTRWEIERAMGLEQDTLAPAPDAVAAKTDADFLHDLAPLRRLFEIGAAIDRGELRLIREETV